MNAVDSISVDSVEFCYDINRKLLYNLKNRYPFAEFSVIGRSWAGRGIFSMSIGEGDECVLFLGGMRGQDGASSLVLYRLFEKICSSMTSGDELSGIRIKPLLKGKKLVFIPCVNPDSIEIRTVGASGAGCYRGLTDRAAGGDYSKWNSNARGVDITYNFDYNHKPIIFGNYDKKPMPSPFCYAGPSPESEPETKALANICERMNFKQAFLLGCDEEKIVWSGELERSQRIAKVLSSVNGFVAQKMDGYEGAGSFYSWFTSEFNRSAFEIQIGKTKRSISESEFEILYNKVEELLVLSAIL
ncbi:MAG: M14 family zinc carboxypeptidase [Oscillospiraceae bacterium]